PPLEQRNAEQRLQVDDVAAHRALRHAQALGRPGEAQMKARGLEGAERVERNKAAVHAKRSPGRPPAAAGRRSVADAPRKATGRDFLMRPSIFQIGFGAGGAHMLWETKD